MRRRRRFVLITETFLKSEYRVSFKFCRGVVKFDHCQSNKYVEETGTKKNGRLSVN